MNSKFFVPFETAKQLKEKGYPQEIDTIHFDGRIAHRNLSTEQMAILCIVAAPTYHEVVDWLEEKGMCIICYAPTIRQPNRRYRASVFVSNINDWGTCKSVYLTREEALNAAILKALEMI